MENLIFELECLTESLESCEPAILGILGDNPNAEKIDHMIYGNVLHLRRITHDMREELTKNLNMDLDINPIKIQEFIKGHTNGNDDDSRLV